MISFISSRLSNANSHFLMGCRENWNKVFTLKDRAGKIWYEIPQLSDRRYGCKTTVVRRG